MTTKSKLPKISESEYLDALIAERRRQEEAPPEWGETITIVDLMTRLGAAYGSRQRYVELLRQGGVRCKKIKQGRVWTNCYPLSDVIRWLEAKR